MFLNKMGSLRWKKGDREELKSLHKRAKKTRDVAAGTKGTRTEVQAGKRPDT